MVTILRNEDKSPFHPQSEKAHRVAEYHTDRSQVYYLQIDQDHFDSYDLNMQTWECTIQQSA